jgi:GNAT superfamily N-acetyltransferase
MKLPFARQSKAEAELVEMAGRIPSRSYGFVRARELEGTYPGPPNIGFWLVTGQRIAKGWGRAMESDWPYDPSQWPPSEPPGMDALAKAHRMRSYCRCRTLDECRTVLRSEGGLISAAFEIDDSWVGSKGVIEDPRLHRPQMNHSIVLVGFDDDQQILRFVHSWGPGWGDEGLGSLPYRYWSERLLEAWVLDERQAAEVGPSSKEYVIIRREATDPWGDTVRLVEVEDPVNDEMMAWVILRQSASQLEIDDFFVRPEFRRRGHGRRLAREVNVIRSESDLPLRAWIPHVDARRTKAQDAVFRRMGLRRSNSSERWAAGCAVDARIRG